MLFIYFYFTKVFITFNNNLNKPNYDMTHKKPSFLFPMV